MNSIRNAPSVDFSKLSLCDALDLSVSIEEEARDRYLELAEQLTAHHTPEAAAFFTKMARVEDKHRRQLRERRERLFGDRPRTVRATMVFDVEAPDYDEARAFMSVRRALEVALRSEEKAHLFFVGARAEVKDPEVRALFGELAREEVDHRALVARELFQLPPDARNASAGDAWSDEPVAQ